MSLGICCLASLPDLVGPAFVCVCVFALRSETLQNHTRFMKTCVFCNLSNFQDMLLDSVPSQPRSVSLPARTHNAAALAGVRSAVADTRRYLHESTSRDFLTSSNSRRDMWRLLLPLPGLFAMLADQWHTWMHLKLM